MRKKGKTILSLLLAAAMLVTAAGCGKSTEKTAGTAEGDSGTEQGNPSVNEAVKQVSSNNGKGRYVEKTATPPEVSRCYGPYLQDDGSILVYDTIMGLCRSEDQGETWSSDQKSLFSQENGDNYISSLAMNGNGDAAAEMVIGMDDDYTKKLFYRSAEGTEKEIAVPFDEEESKLGFFTLAFLSNGELIGSDLKGKVYQIDKESGKLTELFDAGGSVEELASAGDYVAAISNKTAYIYNIKTKALEENLKTLNDFLMADGTMDGGGNTDVKPILFAPGGEENSLYFACKSGLYQYVIGGSVIEQLIDGNLSNLSNPTSGLIGMAAGGEEGFFILYSGPELIHYVYNKDISTVPETQLKVYSLKENQTIRKAINQYQKENPEIFIRYEVGMSGEDGVTYGDALKNLNTSIMGGEGPDVLVLDEMQVNTYQEKGLLYDLSSDFKELTKEKYLTNITDTFQTKDGLYAIPAKFSVPLLFGEKDKLSSVKDLSSFADMVEALREENQDGKIIGNYMPEQVLGLLLAGMWPKVIHEDEIDKKTLTDFLTQAKRISEAESAGWSDAEKKEYEEMVSRWSDKTEYIINASGNAFDVYGDLQQTALGYTKRLNYDLAEITSISRIKPEYDYMLAPSDGGNVYLPSSILAISEKSSQKEAASDFLKLVLSRDIQKVELSDGLPVNREAMTEIYEASKDQESLGSTGMSSPDSAEEMISLEVFPLNEAEYQRALSLFEDLDTPDTVDGQTKELFAELAKNALDGSKTVEETVNELESRMQIRLQE